MKKLKELWNNYINKQVLNFNNRPIITLDSIAIIFLILGTKPENWLYSIALVFIVLDMIIDTIVFSKIK